MSSRSGRIGCRLVIPQRLRRTVLEALHASHLGKEKTKARARQIVYWPGIYRDVEKVTRCCTSCQRDLLAQQQETMMRRPPAERPFELHIDFADHAGRKYLVAVDRYSGWLFVADLGVSAPAYTGPKDDSRRHDERTRYATKRKWTAREKGFRRYPAPKPLLMSCSVSNGFISLFNCPTPLDT